MKQGQHRISQTYLKQFGFKDKNNTWKISVYEKGIPLTKIKSIKSFSKEYNIFDIPLLSQDDPDKRIFETNCAKLENFYPKVIENLNNSSMFSLVIDSGYKDGMINKILGASIFF